METVIVSLLCIALMVFGGMTMSQGFLTSVDSSTTSWEAMGERDEAIMRTVLGTVNATQPSAAILEVTLDNKGQTKLGDFSEWDVIVQYHDAGGGYNAKWLPYTEGVLSDNTWTVKGIYVDAQTGTPEAVERDIFNPGEEMVIRAQLNPHVAGETTNLVVISCASGITAQTTFSP